MPTWEADRMAAGERIMLAENGMQVFAYLDTESVPVAWALVRGVLVSADCVAPNTPEANAFV